MGVVATYLSIPADLIIAIHVSRKEIDLDVAIGKHDITLCNIEDNRFSSIQDHVARRPVDNNPVQCHLSIIFSSHYEESRQFEGTVYTVQYVRSRQFELVSVSIRKTSKFIKKGHNFTDTNLRSTGKVSS
jgi:hypothetical protein